MLEGGDGTAMPWIAWAVITVTLWGTFLVLKIMDRKRKDKRGN